MYETIDASGFITELHCSAAWLLCVFKMGYLLISYPSEQPIRVKDMSRFNFDTLSIIKYEFYTRMVSPMKLVDDEFGFFKKSRIAVKAVLV